MEDVKMYSLSSEARGREEQNREETVASVLGCGGTIVVLISGVSMIIYQVLHRM